MDVELFIEVFGVKVLYTIYIRVYIHQGITVFEKFPVYPSMKHKNLFC